MHFMLSKISPRFALPLFAALLGLFAASTALAQDAAEGKKKAATCIGCHGIHGYQASFPEVHKVPMISGQGAKYIVNALNAYKKGERKHPTMRGIATTLTDKDMADLAAYYESHKPADAKPAPDTPAAPPANVAPLLAKGACGSCHGPNYSKPIDGSYPKLAGQHADYLYVALKAYSIEGKPQLGRGNAIMVGQMKQFNHAEMKLIANYLASLPGELATVPQSKFR
jgi:cytochrome c553